MSCTVAELEQRLDYDEYLKWMKYYKLEPWGSHWHRSSMIAAIIANCHASKGKGFELDAFVPKFESDSDTNNEFISQLSAISA